MLSSRMSETAKKSYMLRPSDENEELVQSQVSLTLFWRLGLQSAEMRILATPAWPYLAAVCRGVSPYCKEQQN